MNDGVHENDGSGHGPAPGFVRLAETLSRLTDLPGLDAGQCQLMHRRVITLLDMRDRFLIKYRSTFDAETLDAYRAMRSDGAELTARQIEDETLHLFALAQLTLAEGAETAGHLERTAGYARTLAETRGDQAVFITSLGHAAPIHDIGLLVVPEEIFARRGLVDSYESMLVDTHTRIGGKLVETVMRSLGVSDGPLAIGCDIAHCHHERYDGLGPQGLAGETIPYAARLFAIADVYDTLRRRRPHRESLDHTAAVVAIRAGNRDGRAQFDPDLLPVFVDCAERFDAVFRAVNDPD